MTKEKLIEDLIVFPNMLWGSGYDAVKAEAEQEWRLPVSTLRIIFVPFHHLQPFELFFQNRRTFEEQQKQKNAKQRRQKNAELLRRRRRRRRRW